MKRLRSQKEHFRAVSKFSTQNWLIFNSAIKWASFWKPVLDFMSKESHIDEVDGSLKIEEIKGKIEGIIKR